MTEPTIADANQPRSRLRALVWAALIPLAAYLLHPALTPVHVEGFSAAIVSIARHLVTDDLRAFDPLFEFDLEFFGLSRLGTNLLVALLSAGLGLDGETAFRVLMWVALAGLLVASMRCVRAWSGAGAAGAFAALLLIPGVSESAFFFNDSVTAAALTSTALALLVGSRRVASAALAGAAFGCAVVARVDAVLIGAAVPLILYEQDRLTRPAIVRALAFGAVSIALLVLVPGYFHTSIIDVLRVSSYAVALWARPLDLGRHVSQLALFTGLVTLPLCALGCVQLVRERAWLRLALLVGVPALFNAVCLGKLWQARQLLPLTPFVAALLVIGVRAAVRDARGWNRRAAAVLAAAVVAFSLLPPRRVSIDDGPRDLFAGRLWTPALWRRWQTLVSNDVGAMQRFVAAAPGDPTVAVVTDDWNADRYAHLGLQLAGYRAVTAATVLPACGEAAELFRRGAHQVLHVRLHEPFVGTTSVLASRRLEELAVPCLAQARAVAAYYVGPANRVTRLFGPAVAAQTAREASPRPRVPFTGLVSLTPTQAVPLDGPRFLRLRDGLRAEADAALARPWWADGQPTTIEQAAAALTGRVAFPP